MNCSKVTTRVPVINCLHSLLQENRRNNFVIYIVKIDATLIVNIYIVKPVSLHLVQ